MSSLSTTSSAHRTACRTHSLTSESSKHWWGERCNATVAGHPPSSCALVPAATSTPLQVRRLSVVGEILQRRTAQHRERTRSLGAFKLWLWLVLGPAPRLHAASCTLSRSGVESVSDTVRPPQRAGLLMVCRSAGRRRLGVLPLLQGTLLASEAMLSACGQTFAMGKRLHE